MKNYETVIGLEVHVELATKTKIFCACSTAFGGAPNTHTCPVCTGQPGSLPVLNKQVVEYAVAVGLASTANLTERTIFIQITHRTIRYHSFICQSVATVQWRLRQQTERKTSESMKSTWRRMPESSYMTSGRTYLS